MRVRPKVRFSVLARDGFRCVYCGAGPAAKLRVDHVYPASKGGRNDLENLVTACDRCNSGKGATPLSRVAPVVNPRIVSLATAIAAAPVLMALEAAVEHELDVRGIGPGPASVGDLVRAAMLAPRHADRALAAYLSALGLPTVRGLVALVYLGSEIAIGYDEPDLDLVSWCDLAARLRAPQSVLFEKPLRRYLPPALDFVDSEAA